MGFFIRIGRGMFMSGGEIAALIAAIAFAALVFFIIRVLLQVSKTLLKVDTTVAEVNKTIQVVTRDVDILSREVEGLLVKSNSLLLDVNQKVEKVDPLFTAIADLSLSVSDLNQSSRLMVSRFSSLGKTATQASILGKVSQSAIKKMKEKRTTKD